VLGVLERGRKPLKIEKHSTNLLTETVSYSVLLFASNLDHLHNVHSQAAVIV